MVREKGSGHETVVYCPYRLIYTTTTNTEGKVRERTSLRQRSPVFNGKSNATLLANKLNRFITPSVRR